MEDVLFVSRPTYRGSSTRTRVKSTCILVACSIICLVVGLLIGFLSHGKSHNQNPDTYNQDITIDMIRQINPTEILNNLKTFTSKPHVAGTDNEKELASIVMSTWKSQGMDEVKIVNYSVLLSYPNYSNPNKVYLLNNDDKIIYTSSDYENVSESNEKIPPAWNAYAPSGEVTGDVVYVNYGRVEDFEELDKRRISVKGKICMARYGKIFRGNKLENAEKNGAIGLIIFMDPSEVAADGIEEKDVYPNSWWMPGSAIQRGSVLMGDKGDPLTPSYPSRENSPRIALEDSGLPKIPCQPIGYTDAKMFLRDLIGTEAPKEWQGGLNVTHIGPGLADGKKVKLVVNNILERRFIYNVIGLIRGAIEPDRYVLYGNHRDAWGFGALDPSSGTAQMMEVTRIIGIMRSRGWKPRRSIVFCNWDGEEPNLIGSTEWVEENLAELDFAVGYINVDTCVIGQKFDPQASPILTTVIKDTTKMIPSTMKDHETLYDDWNKMSEGKTKIPTLGSGTDHAAFSFYAGVPSINFWWISEKNITLYPAYHTAFDTFNYMEKFVDPGMKMLQACGRLSIGLLHKLTDNVIVPYDVTSLVLKLKETLDNVKLNFTKKNITVSLDPIQNTLKTLENSILAWVNYVKGVELNDDSRVRAINDRLMKIERQFILPKGLPSRPTIRNLAFAPSKFDSYAESGFPGLVDLAYNYKKDENATETKRLNDNLVFHINEISESLFSIISLIKPLDSHIGF